MERVYPAGGSTRLVLWGSGLPKEQLEHPGRHASDDLSHRHPRQHDLQQWNQDPGHVASSKAAKDPETAQVWVLKYHTMPGKPHFTFSVLSSVTPSIQKL